MTGSRITPPPALLLRAAAQPAATTVTAEVRSNASLPFDPDEGPAYLAIAQSQFGASVVWRLHTSWPHAQRIQEWLIAPPPGVPGVNQEQAFSNFVENLIVDANSGQASIKYVGAFLTSGSSYPIYTVMFGLRHPVQMNDYEAGWHQSLDVQRAGNPAWYAALVDFLRMFLAEAGIKQEFTLLASSVGSLTANDPGTGNPRYPSVRLLLP